jgi:hypothetical protein
MTPEEIKKDAELEGKKLDDEKTEDAAGGFYVGSPDKYTVEQYSFAGVTWEHNFWSKDQYFIRGVKIDQDLATKITDAAYLIGRPLTDDELKLKFNLRI